MGYTGLYSLGARCGSEAIATGLMIFLGEGTLANELLNKTKGHNMGFGWVSSILSARPLAERTLQIALARIRHVVEQLSNQALYQTQGKCFLYMLAAMQVAFGYGNAFFVSLICFSVRPSL